VVTPLDRLDTATLRALHDSAMRKVNAAYRAESDALSAARHATADVGRAERRAEQIRTELETRKDQP
jgi:hypothetical protein